MTVILRTLTGQQAEALQDRIVSIYRDAFSAQPYCKGEEEVEDFARSLPQHVRREGFRISAALDHGTDEVVGFAYGHANTPDQWWHAQVAKVIDSRIATEWLSNSFRLAEIAVAPKAQGQGTGGLLHDHLLGRLPYQKAVLSTMATETNAYRMYLKRGWVVLLNEISFPGVARPYRIMGLDLGQFRGNVTQSFAEDPQRNTEN
jgi:GNAT superfamily N-acetyltransferase